MDKALEHLEKLTLLIGQMYQRSQFTASNRAQFSGEELNALVKEAAAAAGAVRAVDMDAVGAAAAREGGEAAREVPEIFCNQLAWNSAGGAVFLNCYATAAVDRSAEARHLRVRLIVDGPCWADLVRHVQEKKGDQDNADDGD